MKYAQNKKYISLKFVTLFLTLLYHGSLFGIEHSDKYWKKLLHYDGGRSQVISAEFFVSPNGNANPDEERLEMIRLLNTSDGIDVACNFPARYEWLYQHNQSPKYDLERCEELKAFLDGFQKDKLSIVYVSEYVDSPASAFGHLFILLQENGKALPLADVIHFAAITEREQFLKYAYKGLSGEFDAYFIREPFFIKQSEYSVYEQRSLHIYDLDFSKEQIYRIVLHLYELRKARFNYYFIKENCAFQISELLAIGIPDEERGNAKHVASLPIDVLRSYKSHITNLSTIDPTLSRAEKLFSMLTPAEQGNVETAIKRHESSNLALSEPSREVVSLYYEYSFRRKGVVHKNYNEVQSFKFRKSTIKNSEHDPLDENFLNRLEIGISHSNATSGVLLGYSPVRKDIYDLQSQSLQETEITLVNAQFLINKHTSILRKFEVLGIQSIPHSTALLQPLSWSFYLGINRENALETLKPEISAGVGKNFGSRMTGVNLSSKIGIQPGELYITPSISIFKYLSTATKLGVKVANKLTRQSTYNSKEMFVSTILGRGALSIKWRHATNNGTTIESAYSMPF
ncbi:MAG: DUF4105 domain-containing protein [Gammaproteobacteria bacterium]|nr:DUF4105 domain-containing protein [Sideroxydans sp.]MBU3903793.1 DUF4105 domain-containing protein [Gammaproteobacteria bacterium]MBU4150735.1 DUF4105 domain-containing protein [Gammaproteobacteria bacterium]